MIKLEIPRLPASFTGSGDLFAALFLAHSELQGSIKPALEKTVNTLYEVLKKTHEYSKGDSQRWVILSRLINSNNFFNLIFSGVAQRISTTGEKDRATLDPE